MTINGESRRVCVEVYYSILKQVVLSLILALILSVLSVALGHVLIRRLLLLSIL